MTTTSPTNEHDLTPEQAIREAAWRKALDLYKWWDDAGWRARGGPGGAGYRDPHAAADVRVFRTQLDELVREFGFENTRVDPIGLNYFEHEAASWKCPPVDAPRCTHDSETCPVHSGRRLRGVPRHECGRREW